MSSYGQWPCWLVGTWFPCIHPSPWSHNLPASSSRIMSWDHWSLHHQSRAERQCVHAPAVFSWISTLHTVQDLILGCVEVMIKAVCFILWQRLSVQSRRVSCLSLNSAGTVGSSCSVGRYFLECIAHPLRVAWASQWHVSSCRYTLAFLLPSLFSFKGFLGIYLHGRCQPAPLPLFSAASSLTSLFVFVFFFYPSRLLVPCLLLLLVA